MNSTEIPSETPVKTRAAAPRGQLYKAFWRWHFYAGLFVIPFLFILALSGMLMLLSKPIEQGLYKDLLQVTPADNGLSTSQQLERVQNAYPDSRISLYIPPRDNTESARFSLVSASDGGGHSGHGAPSTTVYVNPYTGEILGELNPANTPYAKVKNLHGTLYMGNAGDALIEIAAGLAILMLLTGIYLTWPDTGWRSVLPVRSLKKRADWRRLHGFIGLLVAIPLLFFLLSGLSWTNVWGGKLVQAWSSLPGTSFEAPAAADTHDSMNQHGLHQVPWALEQTPMPSSTHEHAGTDLGNLDIDDVIKIAANNGLKDFRVHLSAGHKTVWTLSSTTIAGDTLNPSSERTLHIDRNTGEILADIRFSDYPVMGMAMAAFIPLHQGDLGLWNLLLNLLLCLLIIVMIVCGFVLWFKRVHNAQHKLVAPPAADRPVSRAVVIGMLVAALCFPLSALAIGATVLVHRIYRLF
mgnify:CR=1 FL=1